MGEALIVHQVAVQCAVFCRVFGRGLEFLWRRPRGGPTSSSSSAAAAAVVKAGSPPRAASCCRLLLWGFIRLLYRCAWTGNPLVSPMCSHRKELLPSSSSSGGINSALFNLARVFVGAELLNPALLWPLRPHRRAAHHPEAKPIKSTGDTRRQSSPSPSGKPSVCARVCFLRSCSCR